MPASASRAASSKVTGTPINRAIRDLVFQPLGLEHAGTTPASSSSSATPRATLLATEGRLQRPFAPSISVTAGSVGLYMTDLLAYARFQWATGFRQFTRAHAASLEQMRAARRTSRAPMTTRLAWHIRTAGGVHHVLTAARLQVTSCCSRSYARAQLRHRHPDQYQHRLAPDSGGGTRGADVHSARPTRRTGRSRIAACWRRCRLPSRSRRSDPAPLAPTCVRATLNRGLRGRTLVARPVEQRLNPTRRSRSAVPRACRHGRPRSRAVDRACVTMTEQ